VRIAAGDTDLTDTPIRAHSEIKPMSDTAAATTQRWQEGARNSKLPVTPALI
jgi:hypothetical protein